MASRTTLSDLERVVDELRSTTGADFFIDRRSGTPQLYERPVRGRTMSGRVSSGAVAVSPMLSAGDLGNWMRAFLYGIEWGKRMPKRSGSMKLGVAGRGGSRRSR